VADVTGVLAASAAVIATIVAFSQRRKILRTYEQQMEARRSELLEAIEQQLNHAIDLFYKEVSTAFQALSAFCVAQRRTCEPFLHRAEELQRSFVGLASRLG
jgi:hypothetical protein